MSGLVKIFRCVPRYEVSAWCSCGPRWKISQGGSRGGLGDVYGESAPTFVATSISAARFEFRLGLYSRDLQLGCQAMTAGLDGYSVWDCFGN